MYRQSEKQFKQQYLLHMPIVNVGTLAAEIVLPVWGTHANFNGFRVLAALLQRRRSPEANLTLYDVCPSPALVHYIYIFGFLPRYGILPGAKFTLYPAGLALSYFGSVITARHLSSGREPNFAALSTGHHLYSAGPPSRWALAHILVLQYLTMVVGCSLKLCYTVEKQIL